MRLPIKDRILTTAVVLPAAIVVIVLAGLQYRWSNQVSEATSIRLADSLQMSMINWHLDLFRNISEICVSMRIDPDRGAQGDLSPYVRRFTEWKSLTNHPDLVSQIYILKLDGAARTRALLL